MPLQPGRILRAIRGFNRPLYGPLLDFLVNHLRYAPAKTLWEFPYDWRQDNRVTAAALSSFLESRLRAGTERLVIVAHSMGGIIVRLLLADPANRHIAEHVKLVVIIGTPTRGSSKALYTLKTGFDVPFLVGLVSLIKPFALLRLLDALRNCSSMYQLLPPRDEPILVSELGDRFSAMDPIVWGQLYGHLLRDAEDSYEKVKQCTFTNIHAVFSSGMLTPQDFTIDHLFQIIKAREPLIWGDGTVTVASARSAIDKEKWHPIYRPVAHDHLPSDEEVWRVLSDLLAAADAPRVAQAPEGA